MNTRLDKLIHNKTIRNGGLFSIFSFFKSGVSFILLTILAKYIEPHGYGELSLFNTVLMFLGFVVGLDSAGYMSISYFKKSKDEFRKDFTAICVITVVVSTCFLAFISLASTWLSARLQVSATFLYIGLLIAFLDIFLQMNLDYMRVQEKLSWYGVLSCGYACLNFVLTLYLVVGKGLDWQGRVYAQLACNGIFAIVALAVFTRKRLFSFSASWHRYTTILVWSIPLIPHSATCWIKQGMDRIMINDFHSTADVGLFSFAFSLVNIISIIGAAFNQTNSVNLFQTLSSKSMTDQQKISSLSRKERWFNMVYIVISLAVMVAVLLIIPIAIPNYADALPYFVVLIPFGLAQCIYYVYCNYLFYFSQTKQLMYITFLTALLHFLLSYALTRYSLYFTCLVSVVSQWTVTLLVIRKSKKIISQNFRKER